MPRIAPQIKVDNCRDMGAEVLLHGMSFDEAREFAMKLSEERKLLYINGFDHPDIIAGQGIGSKVEEIYETHFWAKKAQLELKF